PQLVEKFKGVLLQYPGTAEVRVRLVTDARATIWQLDHTLRIHPSPSLVADLKVLLGPNCLGQSQ
ncbi:MAG: hypothetical protein ACRCWS_02930, partial [Propionibacteriaceae bacterium]